MNQPKKRQIIISIDDWVEEGFNQTDKNYWDKALSGALAHYDIEITKVEVKDVDEIRPT